MKLKLKYPRIISGKHLRPGIHDVSDGLSGHWYVKALIKNGDAVLIDRPKLPMVQEEKAEEPKVEESDKSEEAPSVDKVEDAPEEQVEIPEKKKDYPNKRHGKR